MRNVFNNLEHFNNFKENGFIVVDFLEDTDLELLKSIFSKYSIPTSDFFYSTSFLHDEQTRKKISQEIQSVVQSKVNHIFHSFNELGAVFLIKPIGKNTQMPLHQDWTVVEEPENQSITIWIPLVDTTAKNGAITVLLKSHLLSTELRSPSLIGPLEDIKIVASPMMKTLEMKAGQAFIFSHALLHASHSNTSEQERIAVAYGLIHEESELIYYHKPATYSKVQKLSIPKDFFISYPEPGKQPADSVLLEEFEYQESKVSIEYFKKFYGIQNPTWWSRLKSIFN